ncbi:MAG: glycosyltransferase family 2 protein [Methylomicrobium sp.]|nr:glycosyltransferase family 2 protein [Methylomicrobium sp.]
MANSNCLLSIIMPIYNVDNYISDAIESILGQEFNNFELIIINDGSTDNSLSIAANYANTDNRIRIISQQNLGPSAARNLGLKNSAGSYIYFFDGDDLLELDALAICIRSIFKLKLDLIVFSGRAFSSIPGAEKHFNFYQKPDICRPTTGSGLFTRLVRANAYSPSPCLYLFSKKIIDQNNLYFDEGYLHEDEGLTPIIFCCAQKAISLSNILFKRRVRENSIMTTNVTFHNVEGLVQSASKIQEFIKQSNHLKEETYRALKGEQRRLLRRSIKSSEKLNTDKLLINLMHCKFNVCELLDIDPAVLLFLKFRLIYTMLRSIKQYVYPKTKIIILL